MEFGGKEFGLLGPRTFVNAALTDLVCRKFRLFIRKTT